MTRKINMAVQDFLTKCLTKCISGKTSVPVYDHDKNVVMGYTTFRSKKVVWRGNIFQPSTWGNIKFIADEKEKLNQDYP
jgi:hypothetical protein